MWCGHAELAECVAGECEGQAGDSPLSGEQQTHFTCNTWSGATSLVCGTPHCSRPGQGGARGNQKSG